MQSCENGVPNHKRLTFVKAEVSLLTVAKPGVRNGKILAKAMPNAFDTNYPRTVNESKNARKQVTV